MREVVLGDPRGGRWRVEVPTRRSERMRGLTGRDRLEPDRAFLLTRTRSIHTVGLRFPLTVALLDARFRVVAVRLVRPRRIVLPRWSVRHVLECVAGVDLRPGDVLSLSGRPSEEKGADHDVDCQ